VIRAVTTLMRTESAFGRIYNVGSDQPISIYQLAQRVVEIVNPNASLEFQSYAEAYDHDFEDVRRRVPDLTRIRDTIGYRPEYSLDDTIRDVWRDKLG
jgi:UDP-glucose 4-epimerase